MSQDTREEWRPIDGFPNYQVSNKGRVMNLKSGRVLKPRVDGHNYEYVALYKSGKPKDYRIHRLTAEAFIPNINNLPQVDHRDENKRNNDVSNLRWVTISENIKHSAHQRYCRINQLSLNGELVKTWDSSEQIKRNLGYSNSSIIQCCKGKFKQAYGYRWEYVNQEQQRKFNRPVAALTKDGEFVTEFKSVAEASRSLKIRDSLIHYCLNGRLKTTHGLRFIYLD